MKMEIKEVIERIEKNEHLYFSSYEPSLEELERNFDNNVKNVECLGQYDGENFEYNGNNKERKVMEIIDGDYIFKIEFWKF